MTMRRRFFPIILGICLFAMDVSVWSQAGAPPGVPVSVVITLEPKRGKAVPPVEQSDIKVSEDRSSRPVTGFTPLRGDSGNLQLMLLIDDSAGSNFSNEIPGLKQWIQGLPHQSEAAVAYMRNGMARAGQNFTTDLAAAAKSIRVPLGTGGADVSPYDSLSEAVKSWPQSKAERHEIVMISSGIEGLGGGAPPQNVYVNKSIADAQRAGIVVFTIYSPSAGHLGHTLWRETVAQGLLSQLADETGGESYIRTFGPPVSFLPFLEEITSKLRNQYLLTFLARPEKKSGLQPIRVSVSADNADVAAPDKVFVKASL